MEITERSTRLADQFKAHSVSWAEGIDVFGFGPRLAAVMDELTAIIGDEVPVLASGLLARNVDHDKLELDESGKIVWPDLPNLYDVILVTDRFIIITWGHLPAGATDHERETTSVWARKNISQVTVNLAPGQERRPGDVATHHELVLNFVDGSELQIPNAEEDLTPVGITALSGLIPEFYGDMSA
ncbi:hypothetical protein QF015_002161 [Paenarthrobacter sp. TE4293]|uniref:hypothetical protein n=1 Tax=Paenarthrobacter sp. TE4293 TaxID=3381695 RepID=UPI003D20124D